jgi:hypothetical protein
MGIRLRPDRAIRPPFYREALPCMRASLIEYRVLGNLGVHPRYPVSSAHRQFNHTFIRLTPSTLMTSDKPRRHLYQSRWVGLASPSYHVNCLVCRYEKLGARPEPRWNFRQVTSSQKEGDKKQKIWRSSPRPLLHYKSVHLPRSTITHYYGLW